MIRFLPPRVAACMVPLALAACDDMTTAMVCDGAGVPSVVVNVMNGARQPVRSTGTWVSGTLSDSMRHVPGEQERLAAYGPAGVYSLRVLPSGAAAWTASNVNVMAGQCGPSTVFIEVVLP